MTGRSVRTTLDAMSADEQVRRAAGREPVRRQGLANPRGDAVQQSDCGEAWWEFT